MHASRPFHCAYTQHVKYNHNKTTTSVACYIVLILKLCVNRFGKLDLEKYYVIFFFQLPPVSFEIDGYMVADDISFLPSLLPCMFSILSFLVILFVAKIPLAINMFVENEIVF